MKGQIGQLMQQAQQMQENLKRAQEEIAKLEVTGSAGGGMFINTKTMIATGSPRDLLHHSPDPKVRRFLTRGESDGETTHG